MRVNPELLRPDPAPYGSRRRHPSVWTALARIMMTAAVGVVGVLVYWLFSPKLSSKQEILREIGAFDREIAQAEKDSADLDAELTAFHRDPEHVVRYARDKLNVARPGEVIFRFEPYPAGKPDASAPQPGAK